MRANTSRSFLVRRSDSVLRHRFFRPQLESLEQRLALATAFGLDTGNNLFSFDTATPGFISPIGPITGLVAGDTIVGMDFRTSPEQLYALGVNGTTAHLYTLNSLTRVATQLGGNIALPQSAGVAGAGTDFGFDFNPVVDRIRVVANNGDNFRLNPNNGTLTAADTALNPGAPTVVGAAYTNNFPSTTSTTLYVIDATTDQLLIQGGNPVPPGASPNTGTLTAVGSGLGVNTTNLVGFDIVTADGTNQAFAALQVGASSQLYSINLATGAATLVGAIGAGGVTVRALALVPVTRDFGDAPDSYGTSLGPFGAHHLASLGPFLGTSAPDFEVDGQPTIDAAGDDANGIDDEDGVALPAVLVAGLNNAATVTASAPGLLDAWIDFNENGVFDANEQIAASLPLEAGDNSVFFSVPLETPSGATYARFRLSSAGGLGPTGFAADGEVEDYQVPVVTPVPGSTRPTAAIFDDILNPGGHILFIAGTNSNDVIVIEPRPSNAAQIRVKGNGQVIGIFNSAGFERVVVLGFRGNDTIVVDARLNKPAELHGNAGNDTLLGAAANDALYGEAGNDQLFGLRGKDLLDGGTGNDRLEGQAGNDLLLGGAGNDNLFGQGGRDILIGGLGSDYLNGGADGDILIGGTTDHDTNVTALLLIMAEWSTSAAASVRIGNLAAGGGLNGTFLLSPGVTVHGDGSVDRLVSGTDFDWYLRSLADGDLLLDLNAAKDRVDNV